MGQETVSIWVTGAMAISFALVHIGIGQLRFLDKTPRSRWLSFAGGVAVAYVFLHILPELAAHSFTFSEAIGLDEKMAESAVYSLALIGLVLFYGTEQLLSSSKSKQVAEGKKERAGTGEFWIHIASSALLIAIIAYLLNHREDYGAMSLAVYFVAMVLHFTTADYGTRSEHPELYENYGRWVLAAATLGGWLIGELVELPQIAIGGLFAFVGGGIVLVVLKEELPEERQSAFVPFFAGAAIYAALVIGETAL